MLKLRMTSEGAKPSGIEQVYLVTKDLTRMTDAELIDYISSTLLPFEDAKYGGVEFNTAEHKLLFLVGGPENDVSVATTHNGDRVYSKPPNHPKAPEITEATAAISDHFEREPNMPHVLSEIADIFYNLQVLGERDPEVEFSYRRALNLLSESLGISLRDGLLLACVKYKRRMDLGKDLSAEDIEIAKLIHREGRKPSLIPEPSPKHLGQAYRTINIIGEKLLKPRLDTIGALDKLDNGVWDKP